MRRKGSVTVFLVLLLTCLLSGIFALLEAARVTALKANAQMSTLQARDGLLSSYCAPLWEKYRILSWEGDVPELSEAETIQCGIVAGNREETETAAQNFYLCPVRLCSVETDRYQLLTDDGGAPFRVQAAYAVKDRFGEKALREVMETLDAPQESKDETESAKREEDALASLEELQKKRESVTEGNGEKEAAGSAHENTETPSAQKMEENPLEWMKKAKAGGFLEIVTQKEEISAKKITTADTVSRRSLHQGTLTEETKGGAFDKLLFRLYLEEFYTNATEASADAALDYEMEYLVAGKSSDRANLRAVVNRLLLLREAANYLYLQSDPEKQEAAFGAALAITGAFGQPEMADAVSQAVLAAWAYAESVSDVRILLDGGKVSLVKTKEQWHTQLGRIPESVEEADGKEQQTGLSYENYLQLLLWTIPDRKLSFRAMDLIEKNTDTRMDEMVVRMDCSYEYQAPELFWSYLRIGNRPLTGYRFEDRACLSYLPDGT